MALMEILKAARNEIPGVTLALILATTGGHLANSIGIALMGMPNGKSPISPIMMAILLGIGLRNIMGLPVVCAAGVKFSLTKILRLGIVLLGIRLSLTEASDIGVKALPVIVTCVTSALVLVTWLSTRLGLSSKLGTLIAAGTGICGATAIVAIAPTIQAGDDETSYAIACITLSGMMAMLAYPFAAHVIFNGNSFQAGLFLGTSVHETAQVAGAGMVYQEYFDDASGQEAMNVATVTKLVRNLGLLVVVPVLSIYYHRHEQERTNASTPNIATTKVKHSRPSWWSMVPIFVVGFAMMSLVRTIGDMGADSDTGRAFGFLAPDQWNTIVATTKEVAELCLGIAMAAVGLGTSFDGLRKLGARAMMVGFFSAALVGVASLVMIKTLY